MRLTQVGENTASYVDFGLFILQCSLPVAQRRQDLRHGGRLACDGPLRTRHVWHVFVQPEGQQVSVLPGQCAVEGASVFGSNGVVCSV
jgi:hypothetical protein